MELYTIGIDLGKTVFQLVGLIRAGEVVVRKRFSRMQLVRFPASQNVRNASTGYQRLFESAR